MDDHEHVLYQKARFDGTNQLCSEIRAYVEDDCSWENIDQSLGIFGAAEAPTFDDDYDEGEWDVTDDEAEATGEASEEDAYGMPEYDDMPDDVCAGIAVHESQPRAYAINKKVGYITYADALDTPKGQNGQLYIGLLFPQKMKQLRYLPLPEKKSGAVGHVIGQTQYRAGQTFTYYFGTGWSKYDVPSQQVWEALLQGYARNLKQPLKVELQ
jgi:hypothetical protein